MAGSFIPISLQWLWNAWNIRGFMILSLFLQLLLASTAQLRKKSNNRILIFVIWSAYFMADWAATYTFGLISNAQSKDSLNPSEVDKNLLAFWAAFLLIYLGGPDTITAFSLEDNALWTRHLVGLVAQLFTFFYIFLNTLPDNSLTVPTILVAVAGALKYGERTRALYLASMESVKKSMLKQPRTSLSIYDGSYGTRERRKDAIPSFQIFKGLVFNIMPNYIMQLESRLLIADKGAKKAFNMMINELDLFYKLFYTKMLALKSSWGGIVRAISYYNVVAALVLYFLSKKEGSHEVDIWITYLLLGGVLTLEMLSGVMLLDLVWRNTESCYHGNDMYYVARQLCFIIPSMVVVLALLLFEKFTGPRRVIDKSLCKKLGAVNLISHCVGQRQLDGHEHTNTFNEDIRDFIFRELCERAFSGTTANTRNEIFNARGNWILRLREPPNFDVLLRYVIDFEYDDSLLAWHIATELLYNIDEVGRAVEHKERQFAKILSDYMNYLLTRKPEMMPAVIGTGPIRYRDTLTHIKEFCRAHGAKTTNEFCTRFLDDEAAYKRRDTGTSVLDDARYLAEHLLMCGDRKWNLISIVWVELLMYAASHSRTDMHPRALSEGGEFITIIWLLMAHLGINHAWTLWRDT